MVKINGTEIEKIIEADWIPMSGIVNKINELMDALADKETKCIHKYIHEEEFNGFPSGVCDECGEQLN